MPVSDKGRSASLAERKKASGLVKVSHSRWVLTNDKDNAREAMRAAADPYEAEWPPSERASRQAMPNELNGVIRDVTNNND